MWTPQQKAQCVSWFIETKSDTQVQQLQHCPDSSDKKLHSGMKSWNQCMGVCRCHRIISVNYLQHSAQHPYHLQMVVISSVRSPTTGHLHSDFFTKLQQLRCFSVLFCFPLKPHFHLKDMCNVWAGIVLDCVAGPCLLPP